MTKEFRNSSRILFKILVCNGALKRVKLVENKIDENIIFLKMVRSCAGFGCTYRWKAGSDVTFHRIPKESQLRQKWLQNIKREGKLPKDENFFICSSHFEESCFQRDLKVNLFPLL